MGTDHIEISDEAYERLKARKRDGESFIDFVDRLLDEAGSNWRDGFGTLDANKAEELEPLAKASRVQTSAGLVARQQEALQNLSEAADLP